MTSNFSSGRRHLRVIPGPTAVDEAADFYDRTITATWRLALGLHDHDARAASDAVVEAYREVWRAGPAGRHQAALLHALVTSARRGSAPVPA